MCSISNMLLPLNSGDTDEIMRIVSLIQNVRRMFFEQLHWTWTGHWSWRTMTQLHTTWAYMASINVKRPQQKSTCVMTFFWWLNANIVESFRLSNLIKSHYKRSTTKQWVLERKICFNLSLWQSILACLGVQFQAFNVFSLARIWVGLS